MLLEEQEMNKPIKIYQFNSEAVRWKLKLSNRKDIQCEVKWYNLNPGWGTTRGWGIFVVEKGGSAN